jgi:hypothetical protein
VRDLRETAALGQAVHRAQRRPGMRSRTRGGKDTADKGKADMVHWEEGDCRPSAEARQVRGACRTARQVPKAFRAA